MPDDLHEPPPADPSPPQRTDYRPRYRSDADPFGPRPCAWCGAMFVRRSLRGRPQRYCKPSHRVRACERRRGLLRPSQPPPRHLAPPSDYVGPVAGKVAHEEGRSQHHDNWIVHLVLPGGLPDAANRAPALCGTMVRHAGERPGPLGPHCVSCRQLSKLHPVNERWWSAATQRSATALVNDMRSLILAVRQAVASGRDPLATLRRVNAELSQLAVQVGLDPVPAPSMHPRSCAA